MSYIHPLKQLLESCDVKQKEQTSNSVSILNSSEKELFNSFLSKFSSVHNKRIIYRGDDNLQTQYNADLNSLGDLSDRIFMVGMKSKYFLDKNEIINFLNTDEDIFEYIFERINNKICQIQCYNEQTKKRIYSFLENNPNIREYFSNPCNKKSFVKTINTLSQKEKLKAKDYYFSLFHTMGRSGNANSYFLSSSTSNKVVANFCSSQGIILVGWLPTKWFNQRSIEYNDIYNANKEIANLGLPIYHKALYPEQKEICLKCGLLPHYIMGFIVNNGNDNKSFIINPAILKSMSNNRSIDDIVQNGLYINQDKENFERILSQTNYFRYYVFWDGKYICK